MATASPAFFFQLQQGGLGHGLGQLRDFDFYDSHINLSENLGDLLLECGIAGLTWSAQTP